MTASGAFATTVRVLTHEEGLARGYKEDPAIKAATQKLFQQLGITPTPVADAIPASSPVSDGFIKPVHVEQQAASDIDHSHVANPDVEPPADLEMPIAISDLPTLNKVVGMSGAAATAFLRAEDERVRGESYEPYFATEKADLDREQKLLGFKGETAEERYLVSEQLSALKELKGAGKEGEDASVAAEICGIVTGSNYYAVLANEACIHILPREAPPMPVSSARPLAKQTQGQKADMATRSAALLSREKQLKAVVDRVRKKLCKPGTTEIDGDKMMAWLVAGRPKRVWVDQVFAGLTLRTDAPALRFIKGHMMGWERSGIVMTQEEKLQYCLRTDDKVILNRRRRVGLLWRILESVGVDKAITEGPVVDTPEEWLEGSEDRGDGKKDITYFGSANHKGDGPGMSDVLKASTYDAVFRPRDQFSPPADAVIYAQRLSPSFNRHGNASSPLVHSQNTVLAVNRPNGQVSSESRWCLIGAVRATWWDSHAQGGPPRIRELPAEELLPVLSVEGHSLPGYELVENEVLTQLKKVTDVWVGRPTNVSYLGYHIKDILTLLHSVPQGGLAMGEGLLKVALTMIAQAQKSAVVDHDLANNYGCLQVGWVPVYDQPRYGTNDSPHPASGASTLHAPITPFEGYAADDCTVSFHITTDTVPDHERSSIIYVPASLFADDLGLYLITLMFGCRPGYETIDVLGRGRGVGVDPEGINARISHISTASLVDVGGMQHVHLILPRREVTAAAPAAGAAAQAHANAWAQNRPRWGNRQTTRPANDLLNVSIPAAQTRYSQAGFLLSFTPSNARLASTLRLLSTILPLSQGLEYAFESAGVLMTKFPQLVETSTANPVPRIGGRDQYVASLAGLGLLVAPGVRLGEGYVRPAPSMMARQNTPEGWNVVAVGLFRVGGADVASGVPNWLVSPRLAYEAKVKAIPYAMVFQAWYTMYGFCGAALDGMIGNAPLPYPGANRQVFKPYVQTLHNGGYQPGVCAIALRSAHETLNGFSPAADLQYMSLYAKMMRPGAEFRFAKVWRPVAAPRAMIPLGDVYVPAVFTDAQVNRFCVGVTQEQSLLPQGWNALVDVSHAMKVEGAYAFRAAPIAGIQRNFELRGRQAYMFHPIEEDFEMISPAEQFNRRVLVANHQADVSIVRLEDSFVVHAAGDRRPRSRQIDPDPWSLPVYDQCAIMATSIYAIADAQMRTTVMAVVGQGYHEWLASGVGTWVYPVIQLASRGENHNAAQGMFSNVDPTSKFELELQIGVPRTSQGALLVGSSGQGGTTNTEGGSSSRSGSDMATQPEEAVSRES